ncbi:MAG: AsmA family protein [Gammaproteobacteria bacterium]|nr:AsmA family protein [Gammaproteobacteria bacterium]
MKTFFKAIGILIVVVVVLVIGAVVALPMLIDPEDVKKEVTAKVKDETGRDLKIVGDVGFTVFPWLGVEMGRVELGNPPGFESPLFAATEKVGIRVKLMPLFERKLEMDTLAIHGLTLNLERNASGKTNWEDLAAHEGKGKAPAAEGRDAPLAAFAIGGLDVRNGTLSWRDAKAGQQFAVRQFSLQTGTLEPGRPVDVKLGFDVESEKPKLTGRVEGGGEILADANTQTVQANGLKLTANLSGDTLPGGKAELEISADVTADGKQQTARIQNLKLSVLDLNVSGNIDAMGGNKGPSFNGTLSVAEFSPRNLMKALGQPAVETADPTVLSRASLNTSLSGTDNSLVLKQLKMVLDDSNLNGDASVKNFAKPAVDFQLALDQIDADRYLPPPKEGSGANAASPAAAASSAGQLPMETLRALDVDGKLSAGKVKIAKLNISDVKAIITARNGVIKLSPVSARLYDGTYAGDIALDARGDQPRISANEKLAGIQAGPLLKDLQGEEKLTGKGDVTVKVTAAGAAADSIKKTLNGNAAFVFRDGAIKGVNIGRMIREARAKLQGKPPPSGDEPAQTDFAELTGTVKFVNGLATNDDLAMKSPLLRVTGAGKADLPSEQIDYRVSTKVVATSQGQGGKELQDLAGVTVPIKVSGTFQQPKYGLDVEALGKALAESKAKELVTEKLGGGAAATEGTSGGAGGDVVEKTKGLIKGIFGN